jgi:predicted ATP-dependent protease
VGLTGTQGVLMPRANLRNLMLRPDVIEAVGQGKFFIYAVSTADEGIEVLTGMKAGERGADGRYPEDSVNGLVEKKLEQFTERQKQLAGRHDDRL